MSRQNHTKVQRACASCGKTFFAILTEVNRGGAKCCSRQCGYNVRMIPIEERFRKYSSPPNEHGCILWIGPMATPGYGMLRDGRKKDGRPKWIRSHQLAWRITHGSLPPKGIEVMHTCDHFYPASDITYRRCVNPEHLMLGTHKDNMAHMGVCGRNANNRGVKSHLSRLSEKSVRQIRTLYKTGRWTMERLAKTYGITIGNVHAIVHRRSWKHIL